MKLNDSWTQQDVFDGKLMFELHYKTYSFVEDYASIVLSAPYCDVQGPVGLMLRYSPPKYLTDTVQVLIHPVQVCVMRGNTFICAMFLFVIGFFYFRYVFLYSAL